MQSVQPFSPFERLIIAALLKTPSALPIVSQIVSPADFSDTALGEVYSVMLQTGVTDVYAICYSLSQASLNALGGVAGLASLSAISVNSDTAEIASVIKQDALRRFAVQLMDQASGRIGRREANISEAINDVISKLAINLAPSSSIYPASDVEQLMETFVNHTALPVESGFGISRLDTLIGGLRPGRFHIIAGYPGAGKTTLMVQAAVKAAKNASENNPVVFVSGEMTAAEVVAVAIAGLGQVDMSPAALKRRKEGRDEVGAAKMRAGIEAFKHLNLIIIEHHAPDLASLELYAQRYSPSVMFCDYLQIMGASQTAQKAQNREQEVAYNAMGLKSLAMRAHCAVVTGSQLNQSGQIRESNAPTHHCDVLMVINLEDQSQPGQIVLDAKGTIQVHKNRGGAIGSVPILFRKQVATFASTLNQHDAA